MRWKYHIYTAETLNRASILARKADFFFFAKKYNEIGGRGGKYSKCHNELLSSLKLSVIMQILQMNYKRDN